MRRYIQTVVAGAILLASGGFLFVTISGWRETGNRHLCQDNLRQFAIGISVTMDSSAVAIMRLLVASAAM